MGRGTLPWYVSSIIFIIYHIKKRGSGSEFCFVFWLKFSEFDWSRLINSEFCADFQNWFSLPRAPCMARARFCSMHIVLGFQNTKIHVSEVSKKIPIEWVQIWELLRTNIFFPQGSTQQNRKSALRGLSQFCCIQISQKLSASFIPRPLLLQCSLQTNSLVSCGRCYNFLLSSTCICFSVSISSLVKQSAEKASNCLCLQVPSVLSLTTCSPS